MKGCPKNSLLKLLVNGVISAVLRAMLAKEAACLCYHHTAPFTELTPPAPKPHFPQFTYDWWYSYHVQVPSHETLSTLSLLSDKIPVFSKGILPKLGTFLYLYQLNICWHYSTCLHVPANTSLTASPRFIWQIPNGVDSFIVGHITIQLNETKKGEPNLKLYGPI